MVVKAIGDGHKFVVEELELSSEAAVLSAWQLRVSSSFPLSEQ